MALLKYLSLFSAHLKLLFKRKNLTGISACEMLASIPPQRVFLSII
jgi:hypothetical protein